MTRTAMLHMIAERGAGTDQEYLLEWIDEQPDLPAPVREVLDAYWAAMEAA